MKFDLCYKADSLYELGQSWCRLMYKNDRHWDSDFFVVYKLQSGDRGTTKRKYFVNKKTLVYVKSLHDENVGASTKPNVKCIW